MGEWGLHKLHGRMGSAPHAPNCLDMRFKPSPAHRTHRRADPMRSIPSVTILWLEVRTLDLQNPCPPLGVTIVKTLLIADCYFADFTDCYFADFADCYFADFAGCYLLIAILLILLIAILLHLKINETQSYSFFHSSWISWSPPDPWNPWKPH